ncbi:hypothetical protein PG984_016366 [Apiospora sp. TS-2023a]
MSASTARVALILGAGANVGQSTARAFAAKGYQVATVARKAREEEDNAAQLSIQGDFAQPESIPDIFTKVKAKFGAPPSVVVYNAGAAFFSPKDDLMHVPLEDYNRNMAVNTTSVLVAAQQAVKGFAELHPSASRTFIFTGNVLNQQILPQFLDSGMGKTASAFLMKYAAHTQKEHGYKFYYADERTEEGKPVYKAISGEAHGQHYVHLSEMAEQGPWLQTFVKGQGYKKFDQ